MINMVKWLKLFGQSAKIASYIYHNEPELAEELVNSDEPRRVLDKYFSKDEKKTIEELKDIIEELRDEKDKQKEHRDYWNSKHTRKDIKYRRPIYVEENNWRNHNVSVVDFIMPHDFEIQDRIKSNNLQVDNPLKIDEIVPKIYDEAKRNYNYEYDSKHLGMSEFWKFPPETMASDGGDCIANYEQIYTKNGLKKVGELEKGDIVLSYDFEEREFVYKPITKIWEKGELEVKRVHLRNGTNIDITANHPLWHRKNANGEPNYEKKYLEDIDMSKWWRRKLPTVKKLDYEVNDIDWLTEDLCFVLGHWLAEGWKCNSKVDTSGYEIDKEILPRLDKHDISYRRYEKGNGVPCANIHKSKFTEYLKGIKENSFDINLPEEIFHLPENKLKALIDGFFLGDGHTRGDYKNSPTETRDYSTSSKKFAEDLQRIHLQLGRPIYIWKEEDHKGIGEKPIYRLRENPNSFFNREYRYKKLSEVSIKKIEDIGKKKVRDFEVGDTHTFVTKNGLVTHNCEDYSHLIASFLIAAGVPRWRVRVTYGYINKGDYGHSTVYVLGDDLETWYHLNSTSPHYNRDKLSDYPEFGDESDDIGIDPDRVWGSFNDKFAWMQLENRKSEKDYKKHSISNKVVIE